MTGIVMYWILGAGFFTVIAVLAVAVFFAMRAKRRKLREKWDEENAWMDSLDDDEWD
ncbi:MAG: hypothetical protein HZA48_11040 [Planctomycetes bacterium]|nr:hypothetical protein [Planctomycetota bacterium]